jgi:hypothetical protein
MTISWSTSAPRSVCNTLFDHTSIIKTIMTRFCPAELEHEMGAQSAIRRQTARR